MADVGIKISATDAASGVFKSVSSEAWRLQTSLGYVSGALASLGVGLSAGAFLAFVNNINNGVDALNDLKDATGASIENISALEDVAKRTGSSLDTVSTALIKLNQGLSAAKPGSDTERAIKAIGLSVSELKALDPAEAFRRIAVSLSDFEDDANKARLTQELFGKSLKEVAPLLKDLASQSQLNATVTTAQADAAEALNLQYFELQKNITDIARGIVAELIPSVTALSTEMAAAKKTSSGFWDGVLTQLSQNPFKTAAENAASYRKELASLAADRDRFLKNGNDTSAIDAAIATLERRQAYFREVQLQQTRFSKDNQSSAEEARLGLRKASVGDVLAGDGGKAAGAAAAKALADQNRELAEQAKLLATLSGVNGDYQEQLTRLQVVRKSQNLSDARYAELVTELIDKQPMVRALYADQEKIAKAWADQSAASARAVADLTKDYDAYVKTLESSANSAEKQLQALQDEARASEIAAVQNISLAQAIEQVTIARLKEDQTKAYANGDQEAGDAIKREIEARKKLATAIGGKEVREANKRAADDAAKEWQKAADKINDSITDALMRGFESGKGFAENLRDVVQNMFKTMVLRPVVQATVNAGLGALGIPGAGGSGGGIGGALNTASNINSLFGTANQALFGASVGASTASLAGANVVGALGGDALGALIAGNGAWAGVSAAGAASAAGGAAAGGAGALAAIPGWGWALGGALLLAGLTGGGGRYVQSTGETTLGFDTAGKETYRAPYRYPGLDPATAAAYAAEYGGDPAAAVANIVDPNAGANTFVTALNKTYLDAAKSLGIAAATSVFSFGGNNAESATGQGKFRLGASVGGSRFDSGEIARSDEAVKLAASRALLTVLSGSDLPKHLQGYLDKAGDAATMSQDQIDAILATASAFKGLHDTLLQLPFENLKDLSGEATQSLLTLAGGMDQFKTGLANYYQAFYSADEQRTQAVANLIVSLNDAGIALPASRDAFRALVDAQDLATESGRKTYATLIGLSGAFASVTAATDAAMKSFVADGAKLQVDLLNAQGDTAGARAAQRATDIAHLGDAAVAQYDYNQSLRDQISAANAAAAAAQNFVSALGSIAATRQSLEAQLLGAQGDTVGALALTRKNELASLTQGLGADDAAKITAAQQYNYALEDQIAALQNAKTAAEASARAQEEASRAADQLRQAWQSVTDSIFGEVKRIRDLMGGNSAQSYAQAQARFSITAAQASAGDQEAAKLLPSLSQALLTLAEAQATSLLQLRAIQGQTAGTLERIGGNYTAQYGLTVPKLATGTNYVPQDMLALIHQGEAVVPARYNPATGGGDNAALVEEIKALRVAVAALQKAADTTADATSTTSKTLLNVTLGGVAMQTEAV